MKTILIEFNELTPSLMNKFIREGHLPNFARFREESQVLTTVAEEEGANLEPWIQWVTVHSGLPFREHNIFHLGQGHELQAPRIWDAASEAGRRVWVCGSMNAGFQGRVNGHFLPDPWAARMEPHPQDLLPYFKFVQAHVQEHSTAKISLSPADYATFLGFMLGNGFSGPTAAYATSQVFYELINRNGHWRRATILDNLQFDLFKHVYKRIRPDLSTFFSNSTAHFQHHFWRHMEPEAFRHRPSEKERRKYASAILFGYQRMDVMLGKFMELAKHDATLILCTALSQQPCLIYEDLGGGVCYRPRDVEKLMQFAGVDASHSLEQAMASRFGIGFGSEADAEAAEAKLAALRIGNKKAMLGLERKGNRMFLDCGFHEAGVEKMILRRSEPDESGLPFGEMFCKVGDFNGMHHPDGLFWIRLPSKIGKIHNEKIALTSVAPTILKLMGLNIPPSMREAPADLAA